MGGRGKIAVKDLLSFKGSEEVIERETLALIKDEEYLGGREDMAYHSTRREIQSTSSKTDGAAIEDTTEDQRRSLIDITPETELEMALSKASSTSLEKEKVLQERRRRVAMSLYISGRERQNKIKSKGHRKWTREEREKRRMEEKAWEGVARESAERRETQTEEVLSPSPSPLSFPLPTLSFPSPPTLFPHASPPSNPLVDKLFNFEEDFSKEKEALQQQDLPSTTQETLPGWNQWGGLSITPTPNPTNTKTTKKGGISLAQRKDHNIGHVIYNERSIAQNKNTKYATPSIPYGYTSYKEYKDVLTSPIALNLTGTRLFNQLLTSSAPACTPGVILRPKKYTPEE